MIGPLIKTAAGLLANTVKPAATKLALTGLHEIARRVAANAGKDTAMDGSTLHAIGHRNLTGLRTLPPGALSVLKEVAAALPASATSELPRLEATLIRVRDDAAYLSEVAQTALTVLDALHPTKEYRRPAAGAAGSGSRNAPPPAAPLPPAYPPHQDGPPQKPPTGNPPPPHGRGHAAHA